MVPRSLAVIFAFALCASFVRAQGNVEQVQAVIAGPITGTVARTLTDHLSARPGVLLCRVDPISRNLLLLVGEGSHLSEEALRHLFTLHGLHLRCYVREPRSNAPFHLIDPRSCGDIPVRR